MSRPQQRTHAGCDFGSGLGAGTGSPAPSQVPGRAAPDAYLDPPFFRRAFAQELPASATAQMAGTQRPAAFATLTQAA
ncbi:hypothetical protein ACIRO3_33590 [Streptomyces sp. NPDC102278]|uniref:hypothetical protein n=1 Tax=Streptomyces sp. NPDC102278 TaxID=3366152 RepID=UPI00382F1DAF